MNMPRSVKPRRTFKDVMCREACCVLHGLWGVVYTAAGSVQLVAGIFFLLSLPVMKLGSNIWTGACNVLIGVGTFMLSCFGNLTRPRSERLLLLTFFALVLNVINLVILEVGEWYILMTDEIKSIIERKNLHDLAFYAHVSTSVTTAIVILVALLDSQLTFCSMNYLKKSSLRHNQNHNETVSDIEYIIPRHKSRSLSMTKGPLNQYTQSWVFDSETGASLNDSPSIKAHTSAPQERESHYRSTGNGQQHYSSTPIVKVQVAEIPEHCGGGDRQINHMKSFSRTPSPAHASQSSSSSSIPPIYECLERLTQPTVYKNRLSTYKTVGKGFVESTAVKAKVQNNDKEHYASLMVELENSFVQKKDPKTNSYAIPPSSTSKSSTQYSTSCCNESYVDSADIRHRGSDAEFSKELEAALKLIQDLESPNTADIPPNTCGTLANSGDSSAKSRKFRESKADSDSTKTLSGSSSIDAHGKNQKPLPVESQSTSGYNSPSLDRSSRFTPTTGISSTDLTLSQENGLSCVIRHMGDTAVISLFSPTKEPHPYSSVEKISDELSRNSVEKEIRAEDKRAKSLIELKMKSFDGDEKVAKARIRRWKHFIDRKRRPSLLPEVESAIVKSECLAFLSESELKDRLNQTKTIHRLIEAKVHRQRSLRKADSFGSVEDIIDRYSSIRT